MKFSTTKQSYLSQDKNKTHQDTTL